MSRVTGVFYVGYFFVRGFACTVECLVYVYVGLCYIRVLVIVYGSGWL